MTASIWGDALFGLAWGAVFVGLTCWALTRWQYSGSTASSTFDEAPEVGGRHKARQDAEKRNVLRGGVTGAALGAVTWPRLVGIDWYGLLASESTIGALIGGVIGGGLLVLTSQNRPRYAKRRRTTLVAAIAGGAVLGLVVATVHKQSQVGVPGWDWVVAIGLGALVAVGELVSRYKDAPMRALLTLPALLYLSINAAAAAAAFALVPRLGWTISGSLDSDWLQVVAAGFGAMALLRSAIFTVRTGDVKNGGKDVGVGLSSMLDGIIEAADRALDRIRAQERAWAVARVMEEVSFTRAINALPNYVVELTQNLSKEDRDAYLADMKTLRDGPASGTDALPEHTKLLNLGLMTMNRFGEGVLTAALLSLSNEVRIATAQATSAVAEAQVSASITKAQMDDLLETLKRLQPQSAVDPTLAAAVTQGERAAASAAATAVKTADASVHAEIAETAARLATDLPGQDKTNGM